MLHTIKPIAVTTLLFILSGCVSIPKGVTPVNNFEIDRYLGKWYEIARIENRFEQGLENVTAEYIATDDGITVVNRGYSLGKQQWQQSTGVAYSVSDKEIAHVKVSFFRPFYGSYVVFQLEQENYEYAFVSGGDKDYLWLLARKFEISDEIKNEFYQQSKKLGFDVDRLVWVGHEKSKLNARLSEN